MRMILPYLFLLSVLLCCSLAAYTQDKSLDSLQKILLTQKEDTNAVNTRNAITKYFMNEHDYKNALKYGENALLLAKKINFKRGTGTAYEYLGWYYDEQNNKSAALENYLASLKIREEIADKAGIAKSQYWIGFAYSSLENFPESLKYWYLALKGYEALGDKIVTATILQLIGGTYSDEGNYPEALKNFIESEKIKEEMGDSLGAAQTYNSIGTIYCNQKKYSEALQQHTTALEIYKINGKLSPDWGIPWSHSCIGRVYYMQGEAAYELENWSIAESKFIKAYEIYLDALKEWQVINRQDGVASVYVTLGELSVELSYQKKPSEKISRLSEARKYYQKALNLSTAIGSKMYIRTSHFGLSNLELTLGNYKEALEHYKIYIEYRDSMLNQENEKKAIDAKTQYEVSKKEDQIKLLSTENKLQTALAQQQTQRKNFAYAGIAVILLAGGYGFYRFRKKKKLQSQQALMNERLRISRELHDEVGATLSGIAMYSHLTKEQIKQSDTTEVEKSLNIMQQSAGEMVNKLNDIVWLVNPDQDSLQKLVQRLEEYARDMAAIKNMQVKVNVPEHLQEHSLPVESRRNIYLFCKEAVNNAVKYSNGTLLELNIKEVDKKLEFSVNDNGKGFDAVMVRRGNGLENMQKRADEIGAKLTLQSKRDEGSMVSMQLKIT